MKPPIPAYRARPVRPWEYVARPKAVAEPLDPLQGAELLARNYLGFMASSPYRRLSELFRDPPPDVAQRLTAACKHLGVTGQHADLYLDVALHYRDLLERLVERVDAGAWSIGNAGVLAEHLKRARTGDAEALSAVVGYLQLEAVAAELAGKRQQSHRGFG